MKFRHQESDLDRSIEKLEQQLRHLRSEQAEQQRGRTLSAAERAEALYELRRARRIFFGPNADLFSEPAWDMLLDLFIAQEKGNDLSVSDTCIGAGVPATTGLRWIGVLETRGLVEKVRDCHDGRRSFVRLTASGAEALRLYLEAC